MFLATVVLAAAGALATPSPDDVRNVDLSKTIVARVGDSLWPNWTATPFPIVLLTANGPALIDFAQPIAVPSFPPQLEATFPLSNGIPTVIIGEPQFAQANTPIRWSVTLLHEHFHQWQYNWPAYQASVRALGLAPSGDTNSMWMLNYPFPYKDSRTNAAYKTLAQRLGNALSAIGTAQFRSAAASYIAARRNFRSLLKANDYKYFAFQCWQEGTARYTEIAVARLAAQAHSRDATFLTGEEASALAQDAARTYNRTLARLRTKSLSDDDRVNFYALGGGEALILDALNPQWRLHYLDPRMDLGVFFP